MKELGRIVTFLDGKNGIQNNFLSNYRGYRNRATNAIKKVKPTYNRRRIDASKDDPKSHEENITREKKR